MNEPIAGQSRLRRFFRWLRSPSKLSLLTLLVVGFVAGIVFWGGFHTAMASTESVKFCTGCHEMRDTVYAEYKDTVHYSNRTGVRATCPDCHVPRPWHLNLVRHVQATGELWGSFTGYIDTKEKFESHRMEMATREWNQMKASDSRECRNCHEWDAMVATNLTGVFLFSQAAGRVMIRQRALRI